MSDRLIDDNIFYERFFHEGEYGRSIGWPHSTTLLYRIRIKTKRNTRTQILLHRSGCSSLQCERWIKIENNQARHAEIIFIEQVRDLLDCFLSNNDMPIIRQISIDIVLSYSPCSECAEKLIKLKNSIANLRYPVFCDMSIKIANFYKHYEPENIMQLIEMVQCQIQISVFNGLCDWKDFLDNTVKLSLDIQSECFHQTLLVRQNRELIDSILLDCIKQAACQWTACNCDKKKYISAMIRNAQSVESSFDCLNFLRNRSY